MTILSEYGSALGTANFALDREIEPLRAYTCRDFNEERALNLGCGLVFFNNGIINEQT